MLDKEKILKERIKKYEEEKKNINLKIRKTKTELRWLKIKKIVKRKDKVNNIQRRSGMNLRIKGRRWE